MENSFKGSAAYDRVVLPDGTIEITYNDIGTVSYFFAYIANFSLWLGIPFSLLMFYLGFYDPELENNFALKLTCLLLPPAYWCLVVWLNMLSNNSNTVIKIHPKVGIEFKGQSLPYKDMESISQRENSTQLHCRTTGQEILIATPRTKPTQASLAQEIKNNSGGRFTKE